GIDEAELAEVRSAAARVRRTEPIGEHETVESCRRIDRRGRHLAPEARQTAALLEHEARHAEQRFAEERAADAGRDLVVARGTRRLARDLPHRAAREGEAERMPVVEAGRAREAEV